MSSVRDTSMVLKEVLNAHRNLLTSDNPETAVPIVLEKVGSAVRVDRVYVFRNHSSESGIVHTTQCFEWVASGVTPQIDNPDLQSIPLREAGYSRWLDNFLANKPIYGNVHDFPEDEKPTLETQGILSLMILPIFASGSLWGFVGFDDCSRNRDWTGSELDLLFVLTIALGTAFSRDKTSQVENVTIDLIGLIGRLLEVHSATFTETAVDTLTDRTLARISALVRAYRFFFENPPSRLVSVAPLIDAVKPYLDTVRGCLDDDDPDESIGFEIGPAILECERALDLVLIITEVIVVLSARPEFSVGSTKIVVSLYTVEGRAELTFTAKDASGLPVPANAPLDGMAFLMLRRLQEHLRAKQVNCGIEGLLFRLSFPIDPSGSDAEC